jgi:outer membrane receptor protein involved in Fe transport
VEAGYQLTSQSFLAVNLFDTTVKRPIVYFVDAQGNDAYSNFNRMASRGAELDYRLQHALGKLAFSYSYYRNNDTQVPIYQVPGQDSALLASPQHKLVLNSTFNLTDGWSLFAGVVYYGERYGWDYEASVPAVTIAQGTANEVNGLHPTLRKFEATPLVNLFLTYQAASNLEVSLGAYNAFGKRISVSRSLRVPGCNQPEGLRLPAPHSWGIQGIHAEADLHILNPLRHAGLPGAQRAALLRFTRMPNGRAQGFALASPRPAARLDHGGLQPAGRRRLHRVRRGR